MKRGDIVVVKEPGSPASKARPCVVVQRSSALETAAKITVCPLTSRLRGAIGQRPFLSPTSENGLRVPSEVEVDWIFTHPVEAIGDVIGRLDKASLETVDIALRRWLDL